MITLINGAILVQLSTAIGAGGARHSTNFVQVSGGTAWRATEAQLVLSAHWVFPYILINIYLYVVVAARPQLIEEITISNYI